MSCNLFPLFCVAVLNLQTRTALLGFLQGKAFFVDLAKSLGGVRPGSGVAVPGLVMESVIGLLTQVGVRTGNENSDASRAVSNGWEWCLVC